jgi:methionine-rich copper-binding protein CopC
VRKVGATHASIARMERSLRSLILVLACLGSGTNAWAHARLVRSSPSNGAIVDVAWEAVLIFDSPVERRFARFALRLPDHSLRQLEAPRDPGLTREITVSFGSLSVGEHQLHWSVVSRDGHRVTGVVRFTIRGR